jgi:hypothetical protein
LRQFRDEPDERILGTAISLADAQFALALEYGFRGWTDLIEHATDDKGGFPMSTENDSVFPLGEDNLDAELAGKPASQRTTAELIPLLAAMSARVLKNTKMKDEYAAVGSLESAVGQVDEDLLRTGLKPLVDGADREIVREIMIARKKALLAEHERRLDMIIAALQAIAAGESPMLIRERCRAML